MDGYVLYLDCGGSCCTGIYNVKTYQTVPFKYVQFIECQLQLNKAVKKYASLKAASHTFQ